MTRKHKKIFKSLLLSLFAMATFTVPMVSCSTPNFIQNPSGDNTNGNISDNNPNFPDNGNDNSNDVPENKPDDKPENKPDDKPNDNITNINSINFTIDSTKTVNENDSLNINAKLNSQNSNISISDINFQWYKNNSKINGATSQNLFISNIKFDEWKDANVKLKFSLKNQPNQFKDSNVCVVNVLKNNNDNENDNNTNVNEWGTLNKDYFVLPGKDDKDYKNRITIPTTGNANIFNKYGNVFLPWKDSKEITEQDLVNMFIYSAIYGKTFLWNFGARNIDSNLLADSYAKFMQEYWIYFPYLTGGQGVWNFQLNQQDGYNVSDYTNSSVFNNKEIIEKYNWTVSTTVDIANTGKFNNLWNYDTKERAQFNEFILNALTKIRPGMSDIDKFSSCLDTVINFLIYQGYIGTPDYGINNNHNGICSSYGGLLALLLNIVGVKALPMTTNWLNWKMSIHECVWVYLDVTGQDNPNNKKWYVSDPTMMASLGEYSDGTFTMHNARTPNFNPNTRSTILTDAAKSQYEPNPGGSGWDWCSNRYNGLIWNTPYRENKVSLGTRNYANKTIFSVDADTIGFIRSKPAFIKGHWYILEKTPTTGTKNILKKIDRDKNGDLKATQVRDWLSGSKYANLEREDCNFMIQINDKVIFAYKQDSHKQKNERKILIVPVDDDINSNKIFKWNETREVNVPTSIGPMDRLNYDYEENGFFMRCTNAVYPYNVERVKIPLSKDDLDFLYKRNKSDIKNEFDVENHARYLKILAGNYKIGNLCNEVSVIDKKNFYQSVDNILKNNKKAKSNKNDLFNQLDEAFNSYADKSIKNVDYAVSNKKLNDVYYVKESNLKKYGFNFAFNAYTSLDDIAYGNILTHNIFYNIYYSKNESDDLDSYTLIKSKSNDTKLSWSDFEKNNIQDPNGYYYIEYYWLKGALKKTRTKVTHLVVDKNNESDIEINNGSRFLMNNQTSGITNYSNLNSKWYNDSIYLSIGTFYNWSNLYGNQNNELGTADIKLKYINFDSKKTTIIHNEKVVGENTSTYKYHELGKINSSNHGIYYIEIDLYNSQNKKYGTIYSDYVLMFSKEDIANFDFKTFSEFINKIN